MVGGAVLSARAFLNAAPREIGARNEISQWVVSAKLKSRYLLPMMAKPKAKARDIHPVEVKFPWPPCPAFELNLCQAARKAAADSQSAKPVLLRSSENLVPARRLICRERDSLDFVPIICEGWAACAVTLADSRRQILSFVLPGEIVSTGLLFEPKAYWQIEAITDVKYCAFNRTDLKEILFKDLDLFAQFSKIRTEEQSRADQLIVDLGRRAAEERIARLILNLMDRLAMRGMAQGETMDFPLRQHHIADATGLTPVHVNKVLSEFRRGGLIKLSDRSLTILDPVGFRRVGTMR